MSLKASGRKIGIVVKLARIGNPLVDQDQTWRVGIHEFAQRVAGACGVLVISADFLESSLSAQLPCQLAPQGTDDSAVTLHRWISRRNLVAYQDNTLHAIGQFGDARFH